jgi:predicted RNA methylase
MLAAMNPGFDSVLVDYGCGKGRTLLIAAECGFSRSVGIEFVPALIEVARLNVAKYRQKTGSKVDIQIVEADAAEYDVQDDQTHYYFYNPFNADVLRQVLQRITESLKRIPRRVCVIYNNPQHGDVVEAAGFYPTMHYERREIVIYSNYPPSVVPECGKLY